jgi:peptidoglycan/xylan/chitin deacetylase (PgdA/CDA1 family)
MADVYLTFDDGPHPVHTPGVLDALSRYGAHATFFQIGSCVASHPELTRRAVAEGHAVGNHTWSHPDLSQLDRAAFAAEIGPTSAALTEILGQAPTLFRPPYGRLSGTTREDAAEAGLETVLWDVDPEDWDCPGVDAIVSRVLDNVRPGSIVLLHDGGGDRSQTVAALGQILAELVAREFVFPPVPAA